MLKFHAHTTTQPADAVYFRVYGKLLNETAFYNASYSQMLSLFEGVKLTLENPVVHYSSDGANGELEDSIHLSDLNSKEAYLIIRAIKSESVPSTATIKYLY